MEAAAPLPPTSQYTIAEERATVRANATPLLAPPPPILGSQSASRRAILTAAGAEFQTLVPDIDEKAIGDRLSDQPQALVQAIAIAKADALVARLTDAAAAAANPLPADLTVLPGTVLLTSDQVVTYEGTIREKAVDLGEARMFVESYSLAPCGTVGGYCLHDLDSGKRIVGVDTTAIHFNILPPEVVDQVVATPELMWCAGALMVEHPAWSPYITKFEGGLDAVMGLGMSTVARLLVELREAVAADPQAEQLHYHLIPAARLSANVHTTARPASTKAHTFAWRELDAGSTLCLLI